MAVQTLSPQGVELVGQISERIAAHIVGSLQYSVREREPQYMTQECTGTAIETIGNLQLGNQKCDANPGSERLSG
jgi:hypothetical protein